MIDKKRNNYIKFYYENKFKKCMSIYWEINYYQTRGISFFLFIGGFGTTEEFAKWRVRQE